MLSVTGFGGLQLYYRCGILQVQGLEVARAVLLDSLPGSEWSISDKCGRVKGALHIVARVAENISIHFCTWSLFASKNHIHTKFGILSFRLSTNTCRHRGNIVWLLAQLQVMSTAFYSNQTCVESAGQHCTIRACYFAWLLVDKETFASCNTKSCCQYFVQHVQILVVRISVC